MSFVCAGRRLLNTVFFWCSEVVKHIVESLELLKCPYGIEAAQIQSLDAESIIPVAQWLLDRLRLSHAHARYEVLGSTTLTVTYMLA